MLYIEAPGPRYRLPDLGVGDPDSPDPLGPYSWQDLRETIYGGKGG